MPRNFLLGLALVLVVAIAIALVQRSVSRSPLDEFRTLLRTANNPRLSPEDHQADYARFKQLLSTDVVVQVWAAEQFPRMSEWERLATLGAVGDLAESDGITIGGFGPVVGSALDDDDLRIFALRCVAYYEIPDRELRLREFINRRDEIGRVSLAQAIEVYLRHYPIGRIRDSIDTVLASPSTELKSMVRVAFAVCAQSVPEEADGMSDVIAQALQDGLLERDPALVNRLFSRLAIIDACASERLDDIAEGILARPGHEAAPGAKEYLDARHRQSVQIGVESTNLLPPP